MATDNNFLRRKTYPIIQSECLITRKKKTHLTFTQISYSILSYRIFHHFLKQHRDSTAFSQVYSRASLSESRIRKKKTFKQVRKESSQHPLDRVGIDIVFRFRVFRVCKPFIRITRRGATPRVRERQRRPIGVERTAKT